MAFGQQQIVASSHLLVFAAWDNYTEERIRSVFAHANQERGIPDEGPSDYELQLTGNYTVRTSEENFAHAARQSYIGLGMALAQAALLQVDATPMEGFNNAELDTLLGLKERGLRSVSLMAIGYRDESGDWLVNLKKVRTPLNQFVIEFN